MSFLPPNPYAMGPTMPAPDPVPEPAKPLPEPDPLSELEMLVADGLAYIASKRGTTLTIEEMHYIAEAVTILYHKLGYVPSVHLDSEGAEWPFEAHVTAVEKARAAESEKAK